MAQSLAERIDTIERAYEFFLAYAAQGVQGGQAEGEIRRHLTGMRDATDGLAQAFSESTNGKTDGFIAVLARDAEATLAAVELVLAQDAVSSQLIDNLNASIHVRALLTDVFLLDEVLKS